MTMMIEICLWLFNWVVGACRVQKGSWEPLPIFLPQSRWACRLLFVNSLNKSHCCISDSSFCANFDIIFKLTIGSNLDHLGIWIADTSSVLTRTLQNNLYFHLAHIQWNIMQVMFSGSRRYHRVGLPPYWQGVCSAMLPGPCRLWPQ